MYEKGVYQYWVHEKETGELELTQSETFKDQMEIDAGSASVGFLDTGATSSLLPEDVSTSSDDESEPNTTPRKRKASRKSNRSKSTPKKRKSRKGHSNSETPSPRKKNSKDELEEEEALEASKPETIK